MKSRKLAIAFMALGSLVAKPALSSDAIEIPMTIGATGKLLVDVKVDHQPLTCIIDTGSPAFLLIDEQIINLEKLKKQPVHARLSFFAEDRGESPYLVQLPRVQIGPLEYDDVKALTLNDVRRATGIGYLELPNFWAQGILGMAFLQHFRVQIDYPRHRLILYPEHPVNRPALFSNVAPTIPVGVSDKSLPFLLDTGSTFSIVSEPAMDALGLRFLSVGGPSPDRLYRGIAHTDTINIGPYAYRDPAFEVAAHFDEYAGNESLMGIIGYDYLKDLLLDLDFPNKKLTITKP